MLALVMHRGHNEERKNDMKFMDTQHQAFYEDCLNKANRRDDSYHKALFYTLGLTGETRRYINNLYDFKDRSINFDGLFQGWQTSTSMQATRMAFNLYNGFTGDTGGEKNDDPAQYSPDNLFCTGLAPFFFEAVKLRYPEYCQGGNKQ